MTEQNTEMLMKGDTQPTFDVSFNQEAVDDFNYLGSVLREDDIAYTEFGKKLQEEIDNQIINMLITS